MTFASRTQFHIERPWGQRPGEGHSRGLLRDYEPSDGTFSSTRLHYISVTEFQIVAPRDISHFALTQAALDEATEPWGIKVERVEM